MFITKHVFKAKAGTSDEGTTHSTDDDDDYGDDLTSEQLADSAERQKIVDSDMSDEEVEAALKAMGNTSEEEDDAQTDVDEAVQASEEEELPVEKDEAPLIPKVRFDEAVGKERDARINAEKEVARLQAQLNSGTTKQPSETELIAAQAALVKTTRISWQKALLDNNETEATRFLEDMTEAETALDDMRLEQNSRITEQSTTTNIGYNEALSDLEKAFPAIDENHADFDRDLMTKIVTLHNGLIAGGMSKLSALGEVAEIYLKPTMQEKSVPKTTLRSSKLALAETIKGQPPTSTGHTDGKGIAFAPSRLSDQQFGKLSEEQKSLLRGDTV